MFNVENLLGEFIDSELREIGNIFANSVANFVSKRAKGNKDDYRETWYGEIESLDSVRSP